jgi:putative thiamine transport system permease protein
VGTSLHEVAADSGSARRAGARFAFPGPLALVPVATVAAFALPIGAGLAGTLLPAFGYLPALGGHELGLAPWRELIAWPGFATSVSITLFVGFAATILSVLLAVGLCAYASSRRWGARVHAWLAPLLATPHSALAIGLAFVIAPSGWIVRAISPWASGWELPPDVATVGHPSGIALVLGLVLKEVPYLVLMIAGALNQLPWRARIAAARALGYRPADAWLRVVLPQVYRQVRLPIYAVLAFSLSVVDVGMILGPGNPPTLAVLAVRWFSDADTRFYFPAAAAATLTLVIVVASIGLWSAAEVAVAKLGVRWIERGRRGGVLPASAAFLALGVALLFATTLLALAGMVLWSAATQWRFPAAWPSGFDPLAWWQRLRPLATPAWTTLAMGASATLIALALTIGCLEFEQRRPSRVAPPALNLLYLPLLVPQIAFLFGVQVLFVRLGFDGAWSAVVWTHLVFVLPYLFLALADPYRALDRRYARAASSLGASPLRILFRVKLPILARPIAIACAVAFAVSVGQYLATLFAGNGRVATLTTEAVTLASGADRRVMGTYALAQTALPLLAYLAAVALPAWAHRNRKALAA